MRNILLNSDFRTGAAALTISSSANQAFNDTLIPNWKLNSVASSATGQVAFTNPTLASLINSGAVTAPPDALASHNALQISPSLTVVASGNVSVASNGVATFTTASAHGIPSGRKAVLSGATVHTALNGTFQITVTSSTTFTFKTSLASVTEAGMSATVPVFVGGAGGLVQVSQTISDAGLACANQAAQLEFWIWADVPGEVSFTLNQDLTYSSSGAQQTNISNGVVHLVAGWNQVRREFTIPAAPKIVPVKGYLTASDLSLTFALHASGSLPFLDQLGNVVLTGVFLGVAESVTSTNLVEELVNNRALVQPAVKTVTANYLVSPDDSTILINAATKTVTLPLAARRAGKVYIVKLIASSTTGAVAVSGSDHIDGATSYSLSAQYKFVQVQSDGTTWQIIGSN